MDAYTSTKQEPKGLVESLKKHLVSLYIHGKSLRIWIDDFLWGGIWQPLYVLCAGEINWVDLTLSSISIYIHVYVSEVAPKWKILDRMSNKNIWQSSWCGLFHIGKLTVCMYLKRMNIKYTFYVLKKIWMICNVYGKGVWLMLVSENLLVISGNDSDNWIMYKSLCKSFEN